MARLSEKVEGRCRGKGRAVNDENQGTPAEQGGSAPTPPPAPPQGGAPTPPPAPPAPGAGYSEQRPAPVNDTSRLLAALGYLFGVVAIIALLIDPYKNEKFVRFHAWQAIGLLVAWVVTGMASAIPILGWIATPILSIVIIVFLVMGAIKAFQGEYWEMPVIYGIFKNSIGE